MKLFSWVAWNCCLKIIPPWSWIKILSSELSKKAKARDHSSETLWRFHLILKTFCLARLMWNFEHEENKKNSGAFQVNYCGKVGSGNFQSISWDFCESSADFFWESMSRKWFQSHQELVIFCMRLLKLFPVLVREESNVKIIKCNCEKSRKHLLVFQGFLKFFTLKFCFFSFLIFSVYFVTKSLYLRKFPPQPMKNHSTLQNSRVYHNITQANFVNFSLETQELLIFHHSPYTLCHGQWI